MEKSYAFILMMCFWQIVYSQSYPETLCLEDGTQLNLFLPSTSISPPIDHLTQRFQTFEVNSDEASMLELSSNTLIDIPAKAFLNSKGELVTGKVEIFYREFNKPIDIFFSGIPMTYEQDGEKMPFQSAGMFELLAFQGEEELFPNPKAKIGVELNSMQQAEDFQVYNLEEETGKWEETGKDVILDKRNSNEIYLPSKRVFFPLIGKPIMDTAYFDFKRIKSKRAYGLNNSRNFRFKIDAVKQKWQKEVKDSFRLKKRFQEIYPNRNLVWVYEGEHNREMAKQFRIRDQINSKFYRKKYEEGEEYNGLNIEDYAIRDVAIEPNFEGDNYFVHLISSVDTFTIPAYPDYKSFNLDFDKKRNEKFYEAYALSYKRRTKEWTERDEIFNQKMEEFRAFQAEIDDLKTEERALTKESLFVTRRRVEVSLFGVCNIDRLMKSIDESAEILVAKDMEEFQKPAHVYILDDSNKALLNYPGSKIRYDGSAKNSLIVITKDQQIGFVDGALFRKKRNAMKGGQIRLNLELRSKESVSKKEIEEALAFK